MARRGEAPTAASPVIVTGLHRSGSTIVAAALSRAGLDLGADPALNGVVEDRGITAINDAVLAALGAAWDVVPAPDAFDGSPRLRKLAKAASGVVAKRSHPGGWGWKDPRTAILLPFWREVVPAPKVVLPLRHPMAVADALCRGGMSPVRALELWRSYAERVLDATTAETRAVVDVARLLGDRDELRRVASFAGAAGRLDEAERYLAGRCLAPPSTDELPNGVRAVYRRLLAEAGVKATARALRRAAVPTLTRSDELAILGVEGDGAFAARPPERPAVDQSLTRAAGRRVATPEDLASVERLVAATTEEVRALRAELDLTLGRLCRAVGDVQATLDETRRDVDTSDDYSRQVQGLREAVRQVLPPETTVCVITRGDDELLRLYGRTGRHFPSEPGGRWLGYHPKNSLAAVAHLETQRALGASALVVPCASRWWLEEYEAFARRLTQRYTIVYDDPQVGSIFDLNVERCADPIEELASRAATSGEAALLDLTKGGLDGRLAAFEVFAPPRAGRPLPYATASVPVVAVDDAAPELLAEARRVASLAVVDVARGQVHRVADATAAPLPPVSIIMPVYNHPELTAAALSTLLQTLPEGFAGEVIVVDDASDAATGKVLAEHAGAAPVVRVLRNDENQGFLRSLQRGIDASTGDYLLFVNNDMVFLDGWLEPLVGTFDRFPDAGVVGGRLLYPDGRLQEAGGVLFADGSAAKYGYGDPDCEAAHYLHVRAADYVSGCLLMTGRDVFDSLDGIDPNFDPGYYEDTDYCLRARLSGWRVYYQPESVVVHVEGGTAGVDPSAGMKRHQVTNHRYFTEKWREELHSLHPDRPDPCDNASLHGLVLSQRAAGAHSR